MLTLTPSAAEAVRQLTAAAPVDEDGGLRISVGEPTPEGTSLAISLVEGPQTADERIDNSGAHVYLEPPVAQFLDDKVLDAEVANEQVRFTVVDQGTDPRMDGRPA